jgi:hypothetical protein
VTTDAGAEAQPSCPTAMTPSAASPLGHPAPARDGRRAHPRRRQHPDVAVDDREALAAAELMAEPSQPVAAKKAPSASRPGRSTRTRARAGAPRDPGRTGPSGEAARRRSSVRPRPASAHTTRVARDDRPRGRGTEHRDDGQGGEAHAPSDVPTVRKLRSQSAARTAACAAATRATGTR